MQSMIDNSSPDPRVDDPARGANGHWPWLEGAIRRNTLLVHALLAVLALAMLVCYYVPPLVRADVYTDDMRQNIAWYHGAGDPSLFQDDIVRDYYMAMTSLGHKALFNTLCVWVDPQVVGEVLSLVLGIAGVLLAYKVGEAATSGFQIGGITAVLVLLFGNALGLGYFIKSFPGGLQRAFALPILLLGTWALLRARIWTLCVALVLAALFYPPTCVNLVAFSASVTALAWIQSKRLFSTAGKNAMIVAGGSLFCCGLLLLAKAGAASHGHWSVITFKEAANMPEFWTGGIWDLHGTGALLYNNWTDYLVKALPVPRMACLLTVVLAFFCMARKFRSETLLLIVSSLTCWILAYVSMLQLYEPNRYIIFSLMALWIIVLPVVAVEASRRVKIGFIPFSTRAASLASKAKIGMAVGFVVAVGIVTTTVTASRIKRGEGGMTGSAPAEVYNFLRSLPKNTKIAAHPVDADDIPMRSQRSVLVFRKAMWPCHSQFYSEMKARVTAMWTAMYATNYEDILQLKYRYGVDALVINGDYYKQDPINEKPYDVILKSCRERLNGGSPPALHLPQDAVSFRSGPFQVIDLAVLDRIAKADPAR
jgi:hypothetical protein